MPTQDELNDGFSLGEWEIYPARGVMRRGDEEARPEPLAWRVLIALAQRDGDLVTREDLINDAWDGRAVADDPINRAISQVRRALGDNARNPRYVETLHRRGFRLLEPVNLHTVAPPEADAPPLHPRIDDSRRSWRALAVVVGLALLVALYFLAGSIGQRSMRSIAVLPFENQTGDIGNDYIASGFKTELIASLTAIDNLMVKNIRYTSLDDIAEICARFKVEAAVFGSIRRDANRLIINYEITDKSGSVTQSADVAGSADDIQALQERLALQISGDLGGERQQRLLKTQATDSRAYDSYMRGMFALERRGNRDNLTGAIELFQESIAIDSSYGPAYLGLATAYALMVDYFDAPLEHYNRLALQTVNAGVAADSSIRAAAGSIRGFVAHKNKAWIDAEAGHLAAVGAELVDANAFNWYSRMLASVGRFEKALDQAEQAVALDPSGAVVNSRLAIMLTWMGRNDEALEYFERANELGAGGGNHLMGFALLLTRHGDIERAREITRNGILQQGLDDAWVDPLFAAFAEPASANLALQAIEKAAIGGGMPPQANLLSRAMLGDVDGALRVTDRLRERGEPFEIELLFIPELAALRDREEFAQLLEDLGIAAYWRARGCVWHGPLLQCEAA